MKKYKLLKDMPFAKAGDMVEMWSDGTMAFVGEPNLPRFNKEDVRMFPLWFEEVEDYFYITTDGSVWLCPKNEDKELDKNRKAIGNYFETIEEAEKYLEYLKAKVIIKQDTKGFMFDWQNHRKDKYYGYWNLDKNQPSYSLVYMSKKSSICFGNLDDIEDSFKKHPNEWKTYLTYEQ